MSLSRNLTAALDALPDHPGAPLGLVSASDAGHRLALDLIASNPLGLSFHALEYATADRPELTADALRAWADRLAGRVTYLMEPLVVVELDPAAGAADLRSQSPTARGETRAFYEVRLHKSGTLRLARVVFDDARRRRPAPCQLTREVLDRLADDLVACAGA